MYTQRLFSRRQFLGQAAAGAAAAVGPLIIPACARAADGATAPNARVQVGFIGVGRRAQQLMGLPEDAQIVAASDVNRKRLEELKAGKGKGWRIYDDYREMLAAPDIDAVVIATPDHWHALNVVHAMQAGKDVYVEKPMTLTIREGQIMVETARKHQRICQVGSQQRSTAENQAAAELVKSGRIGKVEVVHGANYPSPWECDLPEQPLPERLNWDVWCGQTEPRPYHIDLYLPRAEGRTYPDGRPYGWISYRPYSGGEMTGWGAHGLDVIQWALGMDNSGPVEVWAEGEGLKAPVSFRYASGTVVHLDGKGPGGGALFEGTDGTLWIDRGEYKLKPKSRRAGKSESDNGPENTYGHLENWIRCVRSREQPAANVEIGHRSTTMCHLGNIARWTGRKLQWDPEKEEFVNDPDANSYLQRTMRAPYVL